MQKNKLYNFRTMSLNSSSSYFYKKLINQSQTLALDVRDIYIDADGFHIKKGNDEVIISKSVIKKIYMKSIL